MRKPILILFVFLSPLFIFGQGTKFRVTGSVIDSKTGEPLTNVNIKSSNNHFGTITDESGNFTISLTNFPTSLVFTHIGYSLLKVNLEAPPIGDVNVQLSSKATELGGVTVTTERIDTLYRDNKYSVLDYELFDNGVLLLIFKYYLSRAELLFKTYEGDEIAKLPLLPGKPLQFFRDCLGNVHIFTKTRSFQIFFEDSIIKLLPGVDIEDFKDVMGDCKFRAGNHLYFQKYGFQKLISFYYSADTTTKNWKLFRTVTDSDKMAFLSRNGMSGEMDLINISGIYGVNANEIWRGYRNIEVQNRFNKLAYLSPIYAPIERLGDTICIINHPDSVMEFYNLSDSLIFTTPIKYHLTKKYDPLRTFVSAWAKPVKWDKSVIIDEQKQKIYTLFLKSNGLRELREINILTGEISFAARIPFPYIEKIKVRDGYVYFIYKGWIETEKKKLFRQKID